MKVTVNRKALVKTLKALKELSKEGLKYKDNIVLSAHNGVFTVMVGIGTAFIATTVAAEVQIEGACQVSYRLYDLAKLAKDDVLLLSFNKNLSVTGASSFKASLTENTDTRIPYDRVLQLVNEGTEKELTLITEELLYLIDVSKAFPPSKELYFVHVEHGEEGVLGYVQPSEYGTLENFPMVGNGAEVMFRMDSHLLKAALTFCGTNATVSELISAQGFSMVSDPDNPSWFAIIGRIIMESEKNGS